MFRFFFFIFFCQGVFAQNIEFDLTLTKIPHLVKESEVVVSRYFGEDFQVVYSSKISKDSLAYFKIALRNEIGPGLYQIFIGDKSEKVINRAELILTSSEKLSIEANYFQLKNGSVDIVKSIENQAYSDLVALKSYYDPQLEYLSQQRKVISLFEKDYKKRSTEIELQTELLQLKYTNELISLKELYPNTFTSDVLVPLTVIPIRSVKNEWASGFDSYLSFLNQHYFEYCDFSNKTSLNHYALADKIFYYFNNYTEASSDGARGGIDVIMNSLKDDQDLNSFVYNYLLKTFLKLDSEVLTKYLIDNYETSCSLNLPYEELKKLQTIQALTIGGIAPEISLPDVDAKYNSLRDYCSQNKYTVLIFWLSWCSRCQKELPELNRLFAIYKNKGLGVFSVSLDEKKEEWFEKLTLVNKNWINVAELVPIPVSSVIKNYNISTTPLLFVLDNQGKVVTKSIFGPQLEQFLKENLVK